MTWQKPGERAAQGSPADEQSGETSHVAVSDAMVERLEGWRLVPEEPTEEMVKAGWIDKEDVNPSDIWGAMLAAAPSPEAKGGRS